MRTYKTRSMSRTFALTSFLSVLPQTRA